jgi:hypothetical protein
MDSFPLSSSSLPSFLHFLQSVTSVPSLFLFKGRTLSPGEETTDSTDETDVGKAEDTLCSRVTLWIRFLWTVSHYPLFFSFFNLWHLCHLCFSSKAARSVPGKKPQIAPMKQMLGRQRIRSVQE